MSVCAADTWKHRSWGQLQHHAFLSTCPREQDVRRYTICCRPRGKKRDRAVPTPDWRGFAGGDLGSTLVVGSLVAVETVFELMRVSRTCSHGKLSEGLQTNAAGCREPCVDRRDNQRQKKSGPRMQDKGETCSFQDSRMGRRKRRSKWSCQRWRMCVEADGRDTDRQLHISGGLACGKRCQKPGEECSCLGC